MSLKERLVDAVNDVSEPENNYEELCFLLNEKFTPEVVSNILNTGNFGTNVISVGQKLFVKRYYPHTYWTKVAWFVGSRVEFDNLVLGGFIDGIDVDEDNIYDILIRMIDHP